MRILQASPGLLKCPRFLHRNILSLTGHKHNPGPPGRGGGGSIGGTLRECSTLKHLQAGTLHHDNSAIIPLLETSMAILPTRFFLKTFLNSWWRGQLRSSVLEI